MFNWTQLLKAVDYKGQSVRFYQTKYDGIRLLVRKLQNGTIDAYTRNGLTNHWPRLMTNQAEWVKYVHDIPRGTALDCELYIPGQATSVITHIKSYSPELKLSVFGVPMWDGEDWRQRDWGEVEHTFRRYCRLQLAATWPLFPKHKGWLPNWSYRDECPAREVPEKAVNFMRETVKVVGGEGYVLKTDHYAGWYKVKPVRTVDAVVTDIKISESDTWEGGLKAIEVSLYNPDGSQTVIASVGSGFDGEFRMQCDPHTLVGQVAEISYDSLAGKGRLKFPRFVRWREDKSPAECVMEQLQQ